MRRWVVWVAFCLQLRDLVWGCGVACWFACRVFIVVDIIDCWLRFGFGGFWGFCCDYWFDCCGLVDAWLWAYGWFDVAVMCFASLV